MIQTDHHPNRRAPHHLTWVVAHALPVVQRRDLLLQLLRQLVKVLGAEGEPPQLVDARDGADEVAVRDVGQRLEVRRDAARDLAARAHPLPRLFLAGVGAGLVDHFDLGALEGALGQEFRLVGVVVWRGLEGLAGGFAARHLGGVADFLGGGVVAAGGVAHEGGGRGEDAAAALAGLDGPRREGPAVAHLLDVEEDGQLGGAGQEEVAVAAVDEEISGDGPLRGSQTHGDYGTAVDAAGAWGVPWLARVGEDVLFGSVRESCCCLSRVSQ